MHISAQNNLNAQLAITFLMDIKSVKTTLTLGPEVFQWSATMDKEHHEWHESPWCQVPIAASWPLQDKPSRKSLGGNRWASLLVRSQPRRGHEAEKDAFYNVNGRIKNEGGHTQWPSIPPILVYFLAEYIVELNISQYLNNALGPDTYHKGRP